MSKPKQLFRIVSVFVFLLIGEIGFAQKIEPLELIGKSKPDLFGTHYKLRAEAHDAFLKMQKAALKDGIKIRIVSSYRSYRHQNTIWKRKYNKYIYNGLSPEKAINKITEYSTIPGTSRHHWGTDIDIIDASYQIPKKVLLVSNYNKQGIYYKLKKWMDKNAPNYGFYLVYTNDDNRKGIHHEPWHYSYASLSKPMLQSFLKMDLKNQLLSQKLVGSDFFTDDFITNYIENHMLDINPTLK